MYIPRLPTRWKWKLITKKAFLKRDCSTLKLIQNKYFIPIRNYFVQGFSFPSHSLLMGCFFPVQSQSEDYKRPGCRNFGHLTFFFVFFWRSSIPTNNRIILVRCCAVQSILHDDMKTSPLTSQFALSPPPFTTPFTVTPHPAGNMGSVPQSPSAPDMTGGVGIGGGGGGGFF